MLDAHARETTRLETVISVGPLAGNRRIAYLLGLGVLLLLISVAAATWTMVSLAEETERVEHTLIVEATLNRAAAFNEQVETARRGYIISRSPAFRRTLNGASNNLRRELADMRRLVDDNPLQAQRADRLSALVAEREFILREQFAPGSRYFAERENADFNRDPAVTLVREIRAVVAQMVATEANLLQLRGQAQFRGLVTLYVVGGATFVLLIVVLGSVIQLILRYNRSLTAAQALLQRANEGLEAAVSKRTAELQRANQEIQRFAYIVSHDLRSPLVNVLGFTAELDEARKTIHLYLSELFERQPDLHDEAAWRAVEEDLPEALGFIRTSTEKMDRLINSILQLSRQGRRPLTPERLDLDQLVADVIDTLHQRAQDAGATVTAGPLPTIENDRIAVEQILSNLIENAVKYLSPVRAGEIHIEGRQTGRMVQIDVIDNGRGIAPHDHDRIFELFRRSGTQDRPGEGIGLANVRALAYRLGGLIEVESELDRGSRFRLSLPATFAVTEQSDE